MQSIAPIVIFASGAAVGAVVVFLISRQLREAALIRAVADAETRTRAAEAERHAETTRQLENTFRAISTEALRGNNEQFLQLARTELERVRVQARVDLEAKESAIGGLVGPIGNALAIYNEKLDQIERARLTMFSQLAQRLQDTNMASEQLRNETASLARALSNTNVRGAWGELQLRRAVEYAGMVEYCDFDTQRTVESGDGQMRPDVIVRLPGGRTVLVDAKTPATEFLQAANTQDPEARSAACDELVKRLRAHASQLSKKQYWEHLESTPEFVVLFLPSEAFLGVALQTDPAFFEHCVSQNVIVATPATLIAMLKAVAYSWKQESLARNAKEISEVGRELYDRMCLLGDHLRKIGKSLGTSVDAYNRAVGSLETRVLPSARRLRDLGAAGTKIIPELRLVESVPTEITNQELRAVRTDESTTAEPASLPLVRASSQTPSHLLRIAPKAKDSGE